jgi:hypothetical protein
MTPFLPDSMNDLETFIRRIGGNHGPSASAID